MTSGKMTSAKMAGTKMACIGMAGLLVFGVISAPVAGQEAKPGPESLPLFAECMDSEMARFESALRSRPNPDPDPDPLDLLGVSGVEYCGGVGIVRCDRGDAPISCQVRLAKEQISLAKAVIADLPYPKPASQGLGAPYPQLHELARGHSAGPDCAGNSAPILAWCLAWEANSKLRSAVLAWQWARAEGVVPSAIEQGWAAEPAPPRPKARVTP